MKTTLTKLINSALACICTITCLSANAQSTESRGVKFSLGLSAGIPTRDGFNVVYGGDIRAEKDFNRTVSGLLSLGYNEFQHVHGNQLADYGFVPIKVGSKIFPLQNLYVSAEVGTAIKQHKAEESTFLWAPGVGYSFNNGLDLGLRYEESRRRGVGTGQFALRVAYGFSFSNLLQRD